MKKLTIGKKQDEAYLHGLQQHTNAICLHFFFLHSSLPPKFPFNVCVFVTFWLGFIFCTPSNQTYSTKNMYSMEHCVQNENESKLQGIKF